MEIKIKLVVSDEMIDKFKSLEFIMGDIDFKSMEPQQVMETLTVKAMSAAAIPSLSDKIGDKCLRLEPENDWNEYELKTFNHAFTALCVLGLKKLIDSETEN